MASLIIPNNPPFGGMTNQMVGRLIALNSTVLRLHEAVATAAAGYEGVTGTQYEAPSPGDGANAYPMTNNFGVQPDPATPGANGESYRYAIDQLAAAWEEFWTVASPYVEQLDNGTFSM